MCVFDFFCCCSFFQNKALVVGRRWVKKFKTSLSWCQTIESALHLRQWDRGRAKTQQETLVLPYHPTLTFSLGVRHICQTGLTEIQWGHRTGGSNDGLVVVVPNLYSWECQTITLNNTKEIKTHCTCFFLILYYSILGVKVEPCGQEILWLLYNGCLKWDNLTKAVRIEVLNLCCVIYINIVNIHTLSEKAKLVHLLRMKVSFLYQSFLGNEQVCMM